MHTLLRIMITLIVMVPLPAHAMCSGGSKPTGEACGKLGMQGCCEGTNLFFCEGGEKCLLPCDKIPECGWSEAKQYYDCETGGGIDPEGLFQRECPAPLPALCKDVDYAGCCAGNKAWWCDGKALKSLTCHENPEKTQCGLNPQNSVADCVVPGTTAAPECPFPTEGDVVIEPDVESGDGVGGPDSTGEDVAISLDGLIVPDLKVPSTCSSLADRYDVKTTDCEKFGPYFLVKQEGCAALLAGLIPSAPLHPAAKVTKTGLAFDYFREGDKVQCTGSISNASVEGQCVQGDFSCSFEFAEVKKTEPEPEDPEGGGSGCMVRQGNGRPAALILLLLVVGLLFRRRGMPG